MFEQKVTLAAGLYRPQALRVVGGWLFLALRKTPAELVRLNTADLSGPISLVFPLGLYQEGPDMVSNTENKYQAISDLAAVGTDLYCLHQASSFLTISKVTAATMNWTGFSTRDVNDTLAIAANDDSLFVSGYGTDYGPGALGQCTVTQFSLGFALGKTLILPDVASQRSSVRVFGGSVFAVNGYGKSIPSTFQVLRAPASNLQPTILKSDAVFTQPSADMQELGNYVYLSTVGPNAFPALDGKLWRFDKTTLTVQLLNTGLAGNVRGLWSDGKALYLTTRSVPYYLSRFDGTSFTHLPLPAEQKPEQLTGDGAGKLFAASWTDPVRGETTVPPAEVYRYATSIFGAAPAPSPKPALIVSGDATSVTITNSDKTWKVPAQLQG